MTNEHARSQSAADGDEAIREAFREVLEVPSKRGLNLHVIAQIARLDERGIEEEEVRIAFWRVVYSMLPLEVKHFIRHHRQESDRSQIPRLLLTPSGRKKRGARPSKQVADWLKRLSSVNSYISAAYRLLAHRDNREVAKFLAAIEKGKEPELSYGDILRHLRTEGRNLRNASAGSRLQLITRLTRILRETKPPVPEVDEAMDLLQAYRQAQADT